MIRLNRPTTAVLDAYLAKRQRQPLFTEDVGIPDPPPTGFRRNHRRGCLGCGEGVFSAARLAVTRWRQFPGGWVNVYPQDDPVHHGQTVAVVARCLGLWTVNACRVIDISESDRDGMTRFAVTYATLSDHMLAGAECFAVEWDRTDDRVWYDLSSYARPQHWLAWIADRYVRILQRQFAEASLEALQAALKALQQHSPSEFESCRAGSQPLAD